MQLLQHRRARGLFLLWEDPLVVRLGRWGHPKVLFSSAKAPGVPASIRLLG